MCLLLCRGDKRAEMKLVSMRDYLDSLKAVAARFRLAAPSVFLTTEDAGALQQLRQALRRDPVTRDWRLFTLQDAHFRPQQSQEGAAAPPAVRSTMTMANLTDGRLGFSSLLALLLALEADY